MGGFVYREALPGVFHIKGAMDVCMTLLAGDKRALLIDAGYGLEDARAFARTLTDKPVSLLLTHAHHDHALGAIAFERAMMFAQDIPLLPVYTGREQRLRVCGQRASPCRLIICPRGWRRSNLLRKGISILAA